MRKIKKMKIVIILLILCFAQSSYAISPSSKINSREASNENIQLPHEITEISEKNIHLVSRYIHSLFDTIRALAGSDTLEIDGYTTTYRTILIHSTANAFSDLNASLDRRIIRYQKMKIAIDKCRVELELWKEIIDEEKFNKYKDQLPKEGPVEDIIALMYVANMLFYNDSNESRERLGIFRCIVKRFENILNLLDNTQIFDEEMQLKISA